MISDRADVAAVLSGRKPKATPLSYSQAGYDLGPQGFPDLPESRLLVLPLTGMEADPALAELLTRHQTWCRPTNNPGCSGWRSSIAGFWRRPPVAQAVPCRRCGSSSTLASRRNYSFAVKSPLAGLVVLSIAEGSSDAREVLGAAALADRLPASGAAPFFCAVRRGTTLAETEAQLQKLLDEVYGR